MTDTTTADTNGVFALMMAKVRQLAAEAGRANFTRQMQAHGYVPAWGCPGGEELEMEFSELFPPAPGANWYEGQEDAYDAFVDAFSAAWLAARKDREQVDARVVSAGRRLARVVAERGRELRPYERALALHEAAGDWIKGDEEAFDRAFAARVAALQELARGE